MYNRRLHGFDGSTSRDVTCIVHVFALTIASFDIPICGEIANLLSFSCESMASG